MKPSKDQTLKFLVNSLVSYSKCLQEAIESDNTEHIQYFKGKVFHITDRLTIKMKDVDWKRK